MRSNRLIHTAVLCALLATGTTACAGSTGSSDKAAPAASVAAAVSGSASSATVSSGASASPSTDISTMSAAEIGKQEHAAMAALTSMRMAGSITTGGQKVTLDLTVDNAKNCTGTIAPDGQGSVKVIHNSAGTWIQPDAAYWTTMAATQGDTKDGSAAAELFKGRYLTNSQGDPSLKGLSDMCDMIKSITGGDLGDSSGMAKAGTATVDGVPTQVITTPDDSGTITVYVASQGPAYLVRMQSNGSEPGQFDLSDFNKPLDIQSPPDDQVIDFSTFQQKVKSV
ncbi:hypothetical protein ACFZB9_24325 [Kitasatospora sp. NPDC008050]|uniref:hypothetical protein n=1 Tax=Kitasatospora sp. NPDC008050 TaxID=3364021 RepID=UPI0036E61F6E